MNIREVLTSKRKEELQKQVALPEILAAINRPQSARLRVLWIEAIRSGDERSIGIATMRLVTEYLLVSARADADDLITGDRFTAAQVEEIVTTLRAT